MKEKTMTPEMILVLANLSPNLKTKSRDIPMSRFRIRLMGIGWVCDIDVRVADYWQPIIANDSHPFGLISLISLISLRL